MYVYSTLTVEIRKRNSERKKQVEKEAATHSKLCVHNVHVHVQCTYAHVHMHMYVILCIIINYRGLFLVIEFTCTWFALP